MEAISVYLCHVERCREIRQKISPLTSFGRNDSGFVSIIQILHFVQDDRKKFRMTGESSG